MGPQRGWRLAGDDEVAHPLIELRELEARARDGNHLGAVGRAIDVALDAQSVDDGHVGTLPAVSHGPALGVAAHRRGHLLVERGREQSRATRLVSEQGLQAGAQS